MKAEINDFFNLYTKKNTPVVTQYGLRVKGGRKNDFGPVCLRPDMTAG